MMSRLPAFANNAGRLALFLAIVGLLLAGGYHAHAPEGHDHVHAVSLAGGDGIADHDHALVPGGIAEPMVLLHCGADILAMLVVAYLSCSNASSVTAVVISDDKIPTPLIDPPPPRNPTFAL